MKNFKIRLAALFALVLVLSLVLSGCDMLPDSLKDALGVGTPENPDPDPDPDPDPAPDPDPDPDPDPAPDPDPDSDPNPDPDTPVTPPAHEHIAGAPVREGEVAAKCTVPGSYDEVVYCTDPDCGAELSRTERVIMAPGHDEVQHAGEAAKCGVAGWEPYVTCKNCDYNTYSKIPALTHEGDAPVCENEVERSCFGAGSYEEVVYCIHCDTELSRKSFTVPPYGSHSLTSYKYNGDATCEKNGTESAKCDNKGCQFIDTRELIGSILPHSWDGDKCAVCKCDRYSEGLSFELTSDGRGYALVGRGSCKDGHILIPSVYAGLPVLEIAKSAFYSDTALLGVTVPASVTKICASAFSYASRLSLVRYNAASAVAEEGAIFDYAGSEVGGFDLVIGKSVLSVPDRLFASNLSMRGSFVLKSVSFEEGSLCTSIGKYAFYNSKIIDLTIPDSVKTVGDYAFNSSARLIRVTVGSGVSSIGTGAFASCHKLVEVYNRSGLSISVGQSGQNGSIGEYCLNVYTRSGASKLSYQDGFVILNARGKVLLVSYLGSSSELTVPSGVSELYPAALQGLTEITSVTIPDSVVIIGSSAMAGCTSLRSVSITGSLEYFGDSVFAGSDGLTATEYGGAVYLKVGENPYYILHRAVSKDITELTIHNDARVIYTEALVGCNALGEVVIPDGVEFVLGSAFESCTALRRLTLGSGLKYIGAGAFYYLPALTEIVYRATDADTHDSMSYAYGPSYGAPAEIFYKAGQNSGGVTLTVADSVHTLPMCLFRSATGLSNEIPRITAVIFEGRAAVSYGVFDRCSALTDVYYYGTKAEADKMSIGYDNNPLKAATWHYGPPHTCTEGKTVRQNERPASCYLEGSYDEVVYCADPECGIELSRVTRTIPKTDHTARDPVRENEIHATCTKGGSYDEVVYCKTEGCGKELSRNTVTTSTVPHEESPFIIEVYPTCGTDGSGYYACTVCKLELRREAIPKTNDHSYGDIIDEDRVEPTCTEEGGYNKVQYCIACNHRRISSHVTLPPMHSFGGGPVCLVCGADKASSLLNYVSFGDGTCKVTGLSGDEWYVVIPERSPTGDLVVEIAENAFLFYDGVTGLAIPKSVRKIGASAFNPSAMTKEGGVYYVDGWAVASDVGITEATLREGTVGVATDAFRNCTSLVSVTFPDSIKYINYEAFNYASSITNIYISDVAGWCGVEMSRGAFGSPEALYILSEGDFIPANNLVIPDGVTEIRDFVFLEFKNIERVVLPEGLVSVGIGSFYNCMALREIYIPSTLARVGYDGFRFYSEAAGGTDVYITSVAAWCNIDYEVEEMNGYDFTPLMFGGSLYLVTDGTASLITELIIPEGVTKIPAYAFAGQSSITSVSLPKTLLEIGLWAFRDCTGIEAVVIPDATVRILGGAFEGCTRLTAATVGSGVTYMANGVFRGCTSLESLTIPFVGEYADGSGKTHISHVFGGSGYTVNQNFVPASLHYLRITGGGEIASLALRGCINIREITVDGANIAASAFALCRGLVSVTLGEGVSAIGANAFTGCQSLTAVSFLCPDGWFSEGYGFRSDELSDPADAAALLLGDFLAKSWVRLG